MMCRRDTAPVKAHRAGLALDQRTGKSVDEARELPLDLVELRDRWQRGVPRVIELPHAVLGREREIRKSPREWFDELAGPARDDAGGHARRYREGLDQLGGLAVEYRLAGRGREREQRAVEIDRRDQRGRGREPLRLGGHGKP